MAWERRAKIAFIGSHAVRKSNAVLAFAATVGRAGRAVEVAREVVRDNPLPFNEMATGEAQLWVLMSQVRQELALAPRCEILVTDRAIIDNWAYALRAMAGHDQFEIEPFVRHWTKTYDLFVRLTPDVPMISDGVRSTSAIFQAEIEAILDDLLPQYIPPERLTVLPASAVTRRFDWWPIAEQLAALVGQPLMDGRPAGSTDAT